jgi:hypothetical protein
MAFLWWNNTLRDLGGGWENIGEFRSVVEDALKELGFRDTRHTALEVAGGKGGTWLSIAHFHIAGTKFWEVVMAAGDTAEARAVNDQVARMLKDLHAP